MDTLKFVVISIVTIIVVSIAIVLFFINVAPQFGNKGMKNVAENIQTSPNYNDGKFQNFMPTDVSFKGSDIFKLMKDMATNKEERVPLHTIENIPLSSSLLKHPNDDETVITWLGHSSLIIQTQGALFLCDPVFSERASVVSFFGPKRFNYAFNYSAKDFPLVDGIILTHDHYDHLDYKTIKALHQRTKKFIVPFGVKAHLVKWGVDEAKIIEMDWWQETSYHNVDIACVPSRHFTGRRPDNRFSTLWCSYVIKAGGKTLFLGGDSGFHNKYGEIAKKYGPFDVAMLECGAYSKYWPNIHSFPEQTALAFRELNAHVLIPVHWAKFNLSLHAWTEPIERLMSEAEIWKLSVATPKIGERYIVGGEIPTEHWWENKKPQP